MTDKITLCETAKILKENDRFYILSHANPDGDTIGSAYALCRALRVMGKKARVLCADKITERFNYMTEIAPDEEFEAGYILSVDVADERLLGDNEALFGGKIILSVDHHISNTCYAEKTLLNPDAAAAAEIVYRLILELGVALDEKIAVCLYTGISTDTGCFRYSNTTPETHIIAAELMKFDIDFEKLNYKLFDMKTKARIRLEEKVLNTLEYYYEDRCAVSVLTREMLDSVDVEDSNSLSSLPRQIEGVVIGVTLKEKEDGVWKASMRSTSANVQQICKRLGGGGHIRAAGCTIYGSLAEAKKQLLAEVEKELC